MGYLLHIVLAFAATGAAQAGVAFGVEGAGGPLATLAVALLAALPPLLGRQVARQVLRGSFRRAAAGARLLAHLPLLLHAAAVLLLGWVDRVATWLDGGGELLGAPEAHLLLGLAPYVVYELATIAARARLAGGAGDEGRRWGGFQRRLFASGLAPILLFLAMGWSLGLAPGLRERVEGVQLLAAGYTVLVLAVFALALPLLLARTLDTVPLPPGPQRALLESLADRAGFRCRGLRVWRTGGQMANAAIVGFAPWHRIVMFSDALLAQLGLRELAAVFAHEMGHARRQHVAVFATWGLGFLLAGDLLLAWSGAEEGWLLWSGLGLLGVLWYLGFGYLSRRFELEADLEGLELIGDPEALLAALDQVSGLHQRHRTTWRHFSVAERALFLRAAARDPGVGARLRRALRRLRAVGLALFVTAAVLEVVLLAGEWTSDQVTVDLRQGRYAAALRRADGVGDLDPALADLARRAADLPEGLEADALAERALASLRRNRPVEAAWLLRLAVLRGRDDLAPVGALLERALAGDREGARAGIDALEPEGWSAALEAALE